MDPVKRHVDRRASEGGSDDGVVDVNGMLRKLNEMLFHEMNENDEHDDCWCGSSYMSSELLERILNIGPVKSPWSFHGLT